MAIGQYLTRSFNVLNLALLAAAVALFFYALEPLLQASATVPVPAAQEARPLASAKASEGRQPILADYTVIGDKNLFHPERIIPAEKKTAIARPEILLHGTLITDHLKLAYIHDKKSPSTSPGRGVRQSALKEGDLIGGYKLSKITDKMIVLTNGDDQMNVYLDELKDRKAETTTPSRIGALREPAALKTEPRPLPQPAPAPRQLRPAGAAATLPLKPAAAPTTPSVAAPPSTGPKAGIVTRDSLVPPDPPARPK